MDDALKYGPFHPQPFISLMRLHSATDTLENELMGELENARLVRLLCKFGFINERPEYVPPR
jgi:hypothetical protein